MIRERVVGGRYILKEAIGAGGLGIVYRATDGQSGETVAVKELHGALLAQNSGAVERFEREARALARLNHPSIVKILDTVREGGRYLLVMEYVEGGSLAELLQRQGRLGLEEALHIALDLSDALIRAHRQQIIHRDIKPANVLLATDGTPRLADFNVAHISDISGVTEVGARIGTYAYMSPEALRGEPPDERTDVWAFGVTLFEMLAGRRPFAGDTLKAIERAILHDLPLALAELRPDAPASLGELISDMLQKDLSRRLPSMRQAAARLDESLRALRATPRPAPGNSLDAHNLPTLVARQHPDAPALGTPLLAAAGPLYQPDASQGGPNEQPMITLDLTIEEYPGGYAISAASSRLPAPLGSRPIPLLFNLDHLPPFAPELTQWVDQFSALQAIDERHTVRQAQAIGHQLFEQLFCEPEIKQLFRSSYSLVQLPGRPGHLRLRLRFPPSLTSLPWELLFYREQQRFLAHDPSITFARTAGDASRNMLRPVGGGLRIVAVLARPHDLGPIDPHEQLAPLREACDHLRQIGIAVELELIDGPGTWRQLEQRLRSDTPIHVLHFICHGAFDEGGLREGQLAFENEHGAKRAISASLLRDLLNTHRQLVRLVILVACQSGTSERGNPFSSISETLARGGIPAVLAMQFNIRQDVARDLTRSFYEAITRRTPIDAALSRSRLSIRGQYPENLYWAVPVLFLHSGGEQILGLDAAAATSAGSDLTLVAPESAPALPGPSRPPTAVVPAQLLPLVPRNNHELREAELAYYDDDWQRAASFYRLVCQQFRLPAEHLRKMAEAERRLEQQDLLEEVTKYEQQENWAEVIRHLDSYCRRYADDTEATARLERAREESEIVALTLEIPHLAEGLDWQQVIDKLDALERRRKGYTEQRRDLKDLRREALSEITYELASSKMDVNDWTGALVVLDRLPAEYMTAPLRRLKRIAKDGLEQELAAQRAEQLEQIRGHIRGERFADALSAIGAAQDDSELLPELQQLLAGLIEARGVPLELRLRAAQHAQTLGDARPGVCRPPLALVAFPGGEFQIGSTTDEIREANSQHQIEQLNQPNVQPPGEWSNDERNAQRSQVPPFSLSRYLITNGLFQLFLDAHGYDPDQPWWPGHSRIWLIQKQVDRPAYWNDQGRGWKRTNHPVVGVSWYEAQAFCAWLSQNTALNPHGLTFRLPTELEWEYAARGPRRRRYPWGYKEPDPTRSNYREQFKSTTPVGCFVDGFTSELIADMAGNVWEWTSSIYGPYPFLHSNNYRSLKGEEGIQMAVRGGGWTSQPTLLRCAHRYYYPPSEMRSFLGFRIACDGPV